MKIFKKKSIIIIILMLVALSSCNKTQEYVSRSKEFDNWPNQKLVRATPESQGVDSEKLLNLLEIIDEDDGMLVDGIVVIRNGYKIMETYKKPYAPEIPHNLYSCTKSIASTLIGIAIDKGLISSVDVKVLDLFPEYKNKKISRDWEQITLKHLLTMTSGLTYDTKQVGFVNMTENKNWVDYIFKTELISKPGDDFNYSNISSYLLTAILSKQTGVSPLEFARENLFKPLGITNYSWDYTSPQGIQPGFSSLNLITEDLGKIGQLYLQKGIWNGERIISEGWINEATTAHVGTILGWEKNGYGYQWWMNGKGNYSARGTLGQFVVVSPEYNLVIAINSGISDNNYGDQKGLMYLFSTYLYSFLSDEPLSENRDSLQALTDKVNNWSDESGEVNDSINFNFPFTNSIYDLEENLFGFEKVKFEWNGTEGKITSIKSEGLEEFKLTKDGLYQYSDIEEQVSISKIFMREDGNLEMDLRYFPSGTKFNSVIEFKESELVIKFNNNFRSVDNLTWLKGHLVNK